jgi:hypothetical protein
MGLQTENLSGKGSLGIKYRIAQIETSVTEGHTDLGFRKILPVEIRYPFHQHTPLVELPGLWHGN